MQGQDNRWMLDEPDVLDRICHLVAAIIKIRSSTEKIGLETENLRTNILKLYEDPDVQSLVEEFLDEDIKAMGNVMHRVVGWASSAMDDILYTLAEPVQSQEREDQHKGGAR